MRKAFAADFGAGNTCLYCAKPDALVREASPLNTPGGEPSGYVKKKSGEIVLGLGLYGLQYHHLDQFESFRINLKALPTEESRKELTYYFHCWLEKMRKDYPEEFKNVDELYWFIGCPTGEDWKKKETQELYRSIFEVAGFENVHIVPESNAALAFYQQSQRILDDYSENTKLLLIDQGAYSVDATNYSEGKVTSYGGYLGASLIERMIVHTVLFTDEEKIRLKKRMINLPGTIEKARELYRQEGCRGQFYTYLLLQARKLKEEYFTAQQDNTLVANADIVRTLDFNVEDDPLSLFVNPVIMKSILEEIPVRDALKEEFDTLPKDVREEIGNKTWMQAFHDFLDCVDKKYPGLGKGENTIIMLTGGGSLMPCVADAVRAHYKKASVYCDKEAVSAIGKGMAYWAPDKIKALDFERAFVAFTERETVNEEGDIVNSINKRLADSFLECVAQFAKDLVEEECNAVKYGIEQWYNYNCDSVNIPQKIQWYLKDWCKKKGMPSFIANINQHIAQLKTELNSEFQDTAKSFGVEEFELLAKDDAVFLSNSRSVMPIIFDSIVKLIVDHYNGNEIWTGFPNSKKGLFSNPRRDFFTAGTDVLNQWLHAETDSTVSMIIQSFFELIILDEQQLTFLQVFMLEGRIDLDNLMEKHIKEILGKLVLEEYID